MAAELKPNPKTFEESLRAIRSYLAHYPKRVGPTHDALVLRVDSAQPPPYSSHDFNTGYEVNADKVAVAGFSLKCYILSDALNAWYPLKYITEPGAWDLLPGFEGSILHGQSLGGIPKQFDIVEIQYDLAGEGYTGTFDPRLDKMNAVFKRVQESSMDPATATILNMANGGKYIKNTGRSIFHLMTGLNYDRPRMVEEFTENQGNVQTIDDLAPEIAIERAKRELLVMCADEYDKLLPTELWPGSTTGDSIVRSENADVVSGLHAEMKLMCKCFIYRCYLESIFIKLNSGYRDPAQQAGLRKKYLKYEKNLPVAASWSSNNQYIGVETGAISKDDLDSNGDAGRGFWISGPSGGSWHNVGLAFDFNPYLPPDSAALSSVSAKSRWLASGLVEIGREIGLRWGGDFNDRIHFDAKEIAGGKTVPELLTEASQRNPPVAANEVSLVGYTA